MARRVRTVPILLSAMIFTLTACGPALLAQSASTAVSSSAADSSATANTSPPVTSSRSTAGAPRSIGLATAAPSTSAAKSSAAGSAAKAASGDMTTAVYFTAGNRLVSEARQVPTAAPARGSIDALLAGPTSAGHFSQVPAGTRLLSINLAGGTATVSFSNQIQNLEGSPAIPLFLGQVVTTLTQFPDVQRVVLEVNGQPLRTLGGEGVAVPEPLDRATVQRMLAGS